MNELLLKLQELAPETIEQIIATGIYECNVTLFVGCTLLLTALAFMFVHRFSQDDFTKDVAIAIHVIFLIIGIVCCVSGEVVKYKIKNYPNAYIVEEILGSK